MTSDHLETKRKRKLTENVEEIHDSKKSSFSSGLFPPPKLKFSDIEKRVIKCFRNNDFDTLNQELQSYQLSEEELSVFFQQRGERILSWTLVHTESDEALKFLVNKVPIPTLKSVLSKNNFYTLESFLMGIQGLQDLGLYNQKRGEIQVKKFKALFNIDQEAVVRFVRQYLLVNPGQGVDEGQTASQQVEANFEKALAEHTQENVSLQVVKN